MSRSIRCNARAAVTVVFAINGLLYGTWAARIPAVTDRLGLSSGQLGVALGFIAAGALIAMPLSGRAASRFGSRPVTRGALVGFCAASALAPAAPSFPALCLACVLLGATGGGLDVPMNVHGVTVERYAGRPILSSFHAAFSVGGLAGALLGAAGAGAGIDVRVELAALGAAGALAGWIATRRLLPAGADRRAEERRQRIGFDRRLALLSAIAFCSPPAVRGRGRRLERRVPPPLAGLERGGRRPRLRGVQRGDGDRPAARRPAQIRLGPVALVRRGALVGAAGLGTGLVIGAPVAALIAFACLGAGLSILVPQVFRAAADSGDSGPALARVSTVGYTGFLAGPPLIGALSEATSLPVALGLLPLLGLAIAAMAGVTESPAHPVG